MNFPDFDECKNCGFAGLAWDNSTFIAEHHCWQHTVKCIDCGRDKTYLSHMPPPQETENPAL